MWRRATGTPMLAATSRWDWESGTEEGYSTPGPQRDRRGLRADGLERGRAVRPSPQRIVERRLGAEQGSTHARPAADAVGRQSDYRCDQSRAERVATDSSLARSRNLAGAIGSQRGRHR